MLSRAYQLPAVPADESQKEYVFRRPDGEADDGGAVLRRDFDGDRRLAGAPAADISAEAVK